jgi:site-specific DNA-cytosine methylase
MIKNIILDLCGGSGAWAKPYKDAGFIVLTITLPDYNVKKYYIHMNLGNPYIVFYHKSIRAKDIIIYFNEIYGIFAAPPCTEFSKAKGNRSRDFEGAMKIVSACFDIIWNCRTYGSPSFWAMENPTGFLRQFIGKPHYTFEQWMFGEDKVKSIDIWGYFNDPKPTCTVKPPNRTANIKGREHAADWSKIEYPDEYADYINQFKGDAKRAAARAITPAGFATAFFNANHKEVK